MKRFCWFFAVLLAISLSACGGGGGSSTGSSPYSGVTTAAVITEANANDIAMSVYDAGDVSSSLALPLGPSAEGAAGSVAAGSPRILFLVRTLQGVAEDLEARQGASGGTARTVVTESGSFDDGFGGSFSYTISVDDQTGDFTGSFTFANFHGDAGTWMSGSMTASGNFNMAGGTFNHLLFSFPSLTISDGASTQTAMGSVDLWSGNPSTATVNLILSDSLTGKTIWIDHFTMNVTVGPVYTDVTESGTIYLHDYGYVVVSTAVPFSFAGGSTTPSSGVLIITGSSNGRVRLIAIDTITCAVDVDANGDGTYETTFTHPWI